MTHVEPTNNPNDLLGLADTIQARGTKIADLINNMARTSLRYEEIERGQSLVPPEETIITSMALNDLNNQLQNRRSDNALVKKGVLAFALANLSARNEVREDEVEAVSKHFKLEGVSSELSDEMRAPYAQRIYTENRTGAARNRDGQAARASSKL